MNKDDIIAMAKMAGGMWEHSRFNSQSSVFFGGQVDLEHFASLVAAAERDACAKVADDFKRHTFTEWPDQIADSIRARSQQ